MKFGKEFSSQMVQEWQGAYMDYSYLKKHLKALLKSRQQSNNPGFKRRTQAMYRAFSDLTSRSSPKPRGEEEEAVMIPQSAYQTLLMKLSADGAEQELEFFKKLDLEFDKVRTFHEGKVQGIQENAVELSKQMDALIALRIRVERPDHVQETAASGVVLSPDARSPEGEHMDVIQEVEMGEAEEKTKILEGLRPARLQVLEHVKINVDPDTPVSTLKNVVMSSKLELSFSKDELRRAEKKMRKAFIEFHQQLRLLKSYSFLNMLAFSKIMKKYDKITSRNASKTYLEIVDRSSLGSSDEIYKLIEKLEASYIKHFANGNRREGMKVLRPGVKRERHRITFLLGLFSGCCIALIAAIIVSVYARNLLQHEGGRQYMTNIFPLYSLFGYIVLHMVMHGADTYFWRRLRVNYPFIFGSKPETSLGFREVLVVASGLSVLTLAAILAHLDLEMDPETEKFRLITELLPLFLVTVVLVITLCPFNIIYRSSRFFLIRSTLHCIFAPLYKVTFIDFFMADQMTSQIQAIRSLQYYICYYVWGDFRKRSNECTNSSTYKFLYIAVAVIPFWLRLLQCLRRVFEEKSTMQGLNGLKYFSTVVALVMRSLYDITVQNGNASAFWRTMAAATSGITTIYNTYWDIVVDWGLLQKKAKNRWLRDKLLISNKAVYVVAIVVNILLRLVWMQLVLDFNLPFLHRNAMIAVIACLEILRRGIWNFFRLEHEHFNNVENYRAFKSIPMPFYYEKDNHIM
ncbi:phosphate transporter PHO1 homolog 9-like isoform X2 [Salvia splendens]|uniref:phosphate transporter PHO1 homolog 9-like isoform X2 n=1 Tax=Salvia splendens TaxID=180675 RepID=UPI001103829F|nr:phosphate transporter PHO1 homolog 9-like isoform X2 [Salvia splendens]